MDLFSGYRVLNGYMLRLNSPTRTIRLLLAAATAVVCLPVFAEPVEGTAVVLTQVGQVSVIRGTAQALFEGSIVKRQEKIVTGHDGYAKFKVHDGSTFEVFPDSQVLFHDNPTSTCKELLNVFIGRVKVFIQHLNGPNYNSVTTPTAVISVRGTVFDVVVEDDDGTTVVSVDEGKVVVENRTVAGERPLLNPGQWI